MTRRHGISFSLRRASGYAGAKGRLARRLHMPLTRQGRQRMMGRLMGCCLPMGAIALTVAVVASLT